MLHTLYWKHKPMLFNMWRGSTKENEIVRGNKLYSQNLFLLRNPIIPFHILNVLEGHEGWSMTSQVCNHVAPLHQATLSSASCILPQQCNLVSFSKGCLCLPPHPPRKVYKPNTHNKPIPYRPPNSWQRTRMTLGSYQDRLDLPQWLKRGNIP